MIKCQLCDNGSNNTPSNDTGQSHGKVCWSRKRATSKNLHTQQFPRVGACTDITPAVTKVALAPGRSMDTKPMYMSNGNKLLLDDPKYDQMDPIICPASYGKCWEVMFDIHNNHSVKNNHKEGFRC